MTGFYDGTLGVSYDSVPWYLYVVRCSRGGSLYCGIATVVDMRIDQHNGLASGGARYTRSRRPVKLVYTEEHPNRSAAAKAEVAFKKKTKAEKEELIREAS